jgi:hypothetical protein
MTFKVLRTLAVICAVGGLTRCAPVDPDTDTTSARLSTTGEISVGVVFGNVNVGQSATAVVGLENSGGASLTLSAATLSSAPGVTVTGPPLPLTLAPGAAADLSLRFAPTVAGAVEGTLVLTSNAANSPTSVGVTANGVSTTLDAGQGGSGGPIKLVQHISCVGSATSSVTCTLPSPTHVGNLLVVAGGWSPTSDPTNKPSDSFGNTFNLVEQVGSDQLAVVYYAQDIKGGSAHTVTWTVGGGTATPLSLDLAEFSGASTTAAYTGHMNSATGSTATPNAGAVTPAAGSLVFAAMAHDSNVTTSAGSGFSLLDIATDNASNDNPVADEYLIASSASSVSGTFNLSGTAPWSAIVAVFASGGSGGGGGGTDAGTGGGTDAGGGGGTDAGNLGGGGSGTCAPTASGPGGAGAANIPGSQVPAFPKLTNAYVVTGMDNTGNADVGAILQQAMNSHSEIIIPGSGAFGSPYQYNVQTTVNVPDGVIVECEAGAEFLDATPCTGANTLFVWSGTASVTGAGMYGCMFKGSAANISVPTSYNHSFIRLNTASNYTIEGNMTNHSCGDSDIRLDGCECSSSDHGSTGNLVAFNDMENAENGIAVINAWNNTIKCNTAINGGMIDEEPNQSYPQAGGNTYTLNYGELTMTLPNNFGCGTSIGGNGTSCPNGSGVCAKDFVTNNVFNANGHPRFGLLCECNADGTACDNSSFGGEWSNNLAVNGTSCACGDCVQ